MKNSEDAELLSGRQGTFRSHGQNSFRAETDLEALQAWLNRKSRSRIAKTTLDTYRREAERFMLWALTERKTALSSIGPPDLAAYEAFLSAPPARCDVSIGCSPGRVWETGVTTLQNSQRNPPG